MDFIGYKFLPIKFQICFHKLCLTETAEKHIIICGSRSNARIVKNMMSKRNVTSGNRFGYIFSLGGTYSESVWRK